MRIEPSMLSNTHIGRSFTGHGLEDSCPCPQEPCGLVSTERITRACPQHGFEAARTIRQSHEAGSCPAATHQAATAEPR